MTSVSIPPFGGTDNSETDPRFLTVPPMAAETPSHDIRAESAARRRRRATAASRTERAAKVSRHHHYVAGILGVDPTETLNRRELEAALRCSRSTLHSVTQRNAAELVAAGWDQTADAFTAAAAGTVALLMRPATSETVAAIHAATSPGGGLKKLRFATRDAAPSAAHGLFAEEAFGRALRLAEDVKDCDPGENWLSLRTLSRSELAALAITLAALVPVDQPGLTRWIVDQSDSRTVRGGLATIIPTRDTADAGVPTSSLFAITDAVAGVI